MNISECLSVFALLAVPLSAHAVVRISIHAISENPVVYGPCQVKRGARNRASDHRSDVPLIPLAISPTEDLMVSLIILLLVQHSDHRAARQGLKQRANDLTERVRYPKHRLYSSPPEKRKCSGAGDGGHPSRT